MNARDKVVAGGLALALSGSVCAQSGNSGVARDRMRSASSTSDTTSRARENVLREIDDPATGDLWLLLRDPSQPAGPGRLVLAPQRTVSQKRMGDGPAPAVPGGERPVIHTGDALTVEEHTPVVDARLEGVALGPAAKGAYFRARLKIGGKVVRVEAVAPGHAVFGPESEVEP